MIASFDKELVGSPLEDDLIRLWNRSIGSSFPLDRRLYEQQIRLDKDEKAIFVMRQDNEIHGALLAKRPRRSSSSGQIPALANISFLIVDRKSRRQRIASQLLEAAELWAAGRGASRLAIGRDRYHFFPGCPAAGGSCKVPDPEAEGFKAAAAFFDARGFAFAPGHESDLIADLQESGSLLGGAPKLPEGFSFGAYNPQERVQLLQFFRKNFPGRWLDDTTEALDAGMRPKDLCILRDQKGATAGFARIYDKDSPVIGPGTYWRQLLGSEPGGLGPIGLDEDLRGRGLGLELLRLSLKELASRGTGLTVIDWTTLDTFYGKLGFAPWKLYRMGEKAIDTKSLP